MALPPVEYCSPSSAGGTSIGHRAAERVRQKCAGLASTVRSEREERKKFSKVGPGTRAATEEEKHQVSTLLNQRMQQIFLDPQARSWYKLFCHMDDDLSGKVTFTEFEDMIRNELMMTDSKISHEQLKAVWRALDADCSGLITTGEFGQFMRIGEHVHHAEESLKSKNLKKREAEGEETRQQHKEMMTTWQEEKSSADKAAIERTMRMREHQAGRVQDAIARVKQRNAAAAQSYRQQRDERLSRHLIAKGAAARTASAHECEQFSIMLNERMIQVFHDPQARSWYKLFVHMDDDMSGKINYHELEDMVRNELKVSRERFTEDQLKGVWLALDADKSGLITAGEFGKFMRLGEHVHDATESLKTKFERAKKAEAAASRQDKHGNLEEWKQLRAAEDTSRRLRAAEAHNVAWGLQAPADPRPIWRSPRAYVY